MAGFPRVAGGSGARTTCVFYSAAGAGPKGTNDRARLCPRRAPRSPNSCRVVSTLRLGAVDRGRRIGRGGSAQAGRGRTASDRRTRVRGARAGASGNRGASPAGEIRIQRREAAGVAVMAAAAAADPVQRLVGQPLPEAPAATAMAPLARGAATRAARATAVNGRDCRCGRRSRLGGGVRRAQRAGSQ